VSSASLGCGKSSQLLAPGRVTASRLLQSTLRDDPLRTASGEHAIANVAERSSGVDTGRCLLSRRSDRATTASVMAKAITATTQLDSLQRTRSHKG
jgi:hypothetical protein